MGGRMDIDFADLLMEVVSRKASDLHVSAGAHPTIRVRGHLTPLENYPKLSGMDTREIIYSILNGDQRQRLETHWQLDFAYSIPGHARFRVNAYFQRGAIGAAFRLIPFGLSSIDELGLPATVHDFTRSEEHTSELQSPDQLVYRLLLEKKKKKKKQKQTKKP